MFSFFDLKKSYSFNAKVASSFLLLAIFLISILSTLIIPKIQEDEYNNTIEEIEKILFITKEQIRIAGAALTIQSKLEVKYTKKSLEYDLLKISNKVENSSLLIEDIKKEFEKSEILKSCNYAIKTSSSLFVNKDLNIYKDYKMKEYSTWEKFKTKKLNRSYDSKLKYSFFTKKVKDIELSIFCTGGALNKNHDSFEVGIKKHVQNTFTTTSDLHRGKTYLFWLNNKSSLDEVLFEKDKDKMAKKYTVSNMSNVKNIFTGDLTSKEIIKARNGEPIAHKLNGQDAISWIIDVYKGEYENYMLLLVKTIYKEDLKSQVDSALFKILPASVISLFLALIIGFFLFKRLFKSINILTNTAHEIKLGNNHIRTNVKGNDDIGNLGVVFDSMLDSFENSIKNLDIKVEEKTKELQVSLEEKDILLKEIHHRVKNNLALTISLIKLQEEEIKEEGSKKILNDIQERIYTMELLHRKLYESPNLNKINFKEYVETLVDSIAKTYFLKEKVTFNINIKSLFLDIETAMPCGLILNEIITNSFKYAFVNNKNPKLDITMTKENKNYILEIKDNGEGFKKQIDINTSSTLGLRLITSIARLQMQGELSCVNNSGVSYSLVFQEKT